jgi:hypothetical protein
MLADMEEEIAKRPLPGGPSLHAGLWCKTQNSYPHPEYTFRAQTSIRTPKEPLACLCLGANVVEMVGEVVVGIGVGRFRAGVLLEGEVVREG